MVRHVNWNGVFPAVTTQFREDFSLDIEATQRVIEGLLRDGVSGLIVCGTVGENCSLARPEKIAVMEAAKEVVRGRVPILAGIAEFTTAFAIETAREAEIVGLDGIMVMPALVYSSKPHETIAHYEGVAKSCGLPIMVYNNPPIYRTDVTPEILTALAGCETIVAFKDSSGDTRRFTDVRNRSRRCGDGKRHGRGGRLGLRPLQRLSTRGRDFVPPRPRRALPRGHAAL
jgi:1-pyrroline-4-hydroxy-2-carboxylate deaminase